MYWSEWQIKRIEGWMVISITEKNEVAEGYNTNQGKGLVMYWRGPFIPCHSGISMWELMDDSGIWNF